MGKIHRIVPFGFWPAHWGLSGSTRAKAQAEYTLDGEDLAYRLLDIEYPDLSDKEYDWALEYRTDKLKLDYRYHKIGEYDFGLGIIENNPSLSEVDREREIAKYLHRFGKISAEELEYRLFELSYEVKHTDAYVREKLKLDVKFGKVTEEAADHILLDLKYEDKESVAYLKEQLLLERKYGNITVNEYEKEVATLDKEPWFNWVAADRRISGDTVQAAVEMDWNSYFIKFLEKNGWTGATEDEIMDNWFEDMMKQQFNIYDASLGDDGSANPMPLAGRKLRDDGLAEYR